MENFNPVDLLNFVDLGVLGLVLWWLMVRVEKRIEAHSQSNKMLARQINIMARAVIRALALREADGGHVGLAAEFEEELQRAASASNING